MMFIAVKWGVPPTPSDLSFDVQFSGSTPLCILLCVVNEKKNPLRNTEVVYQVKSGIRIMKS